FGRDVPWLPKKLRKRGFSEEKLVKARDKVRPSTQKIDKAIKPRLHALATPLVARIVGAVCVLIALPMPALEVVPFASSAPSVAIALFGLGLSARDGLLILLGFIVAFAACAGAAYWLLF